MKILLALLILALPALCQEETVMDEIDHKISLTLNPIDEIDTSWITEELRPVVIRKLLKKMDDQSPDREGLKYEAELQLVILGHVETIQRLVAEAEINRHNNVLNMVATEVAIPYMMPVVYNGSTDIPKRTSDVGYDSLRDEFGTTVLRVIERSKVFPAETKEWAKNMLANHFVKEEHVDLLKRWWENNRQAIEEKRYAEATWLPRYKGKPLYVAESEVESLERRLEIGRQIEAKEEADRQRAAREATKPPEAPAPPAPAKEKSAPWLWISLGAHAVFLAGFFVRRSLTRTKP